MSLFWLRQPGPCGGQGRLSGFSTTCTGHTKAVRKHSISTDTALLTPTARLPCSTKSPCEALHVPANVPGAPTPNQSSHLGNPNHGSISLCPGTRDSSATTAPSTSGSSELGPSCPGRLGQPRVRSPPHAGVHVGCCMWESLSLSRLLLNINNKQVNL